MRGIPPTWQNHTNDLPIPWEDWSDLFQMALIAKKSIGIDNLINLSDRIKATPAAFDETPDSARSLKD